MLGLKKKFKRFLNFFFIFFKIATYKYISYYMYSKTTNNPLGGGISMKLDILALRNELVGRIYCNMTNASYDDSAGLTIPSETEIREMFADFEDYDVYIDILDDGIIGNLMKFKALVPDDAEGAYSKLENVEDIYGIKLKKGDEEIFSVEYEIEKSVQSRTGLDNLIEEYSRNNTNNSSTPDEVEPAELGEPNHVDDDREI